MSEEEKKIGREATLAGAGSGTVIASIISLLPDNGTRSVLLILAPTLAVLVTAVWGQISSFLDDKLADIKVSRERRRAEKIVASLEAQTNTDPATRSEMKKQLEALKLLELRISQKRIEAVLAEDGSQV